MRWKQITLVAVVLLMATPALQATNLPPGATNVIPNSATLDNTTLLGTRVLTYTGVDALGATRFVAILTNQVYRDNATGTLLFTYQVENSATSIDPIRRLSSIDFTGFTLDVSSTDFSGQVRADRSLDGSVVGFINFGPDGPTSALSPGEMSAFLVIRTDALFFGDGSTSLINGATANGVTFAPLAVVPEPGTFALAAVGLPLAVGCYRRYRRKPSV
jgi:hypothetical protein